jgi:uncharacterized membrane protein YeaQ/YmgE (transglycosylase-associated protein family)
LGVYYAYHLNRNKVKLVETLVPFLIQVISGAVGGNVAGAALKNLNLGVLGNTLAGIVGGGIGGQLIALAGAGNIGGLAGDILSGCIGGGILMVMAGFLRKTRPG